MELVTICFGLLAPHCLNWDCSGVAACPSYSSESPYRPGAEVPERIPSVIRKWNYVVELGKKILFDIPWLKSSRSLKLRFVLSHRSRRRWFLMSIRSKHKPASNVKLEASWWMQSFWFTRTSRLAYPCQFSDLFPLTCSLSMWHCRRPPKPQGMVNEHLCTVLLDVWCTSTWMSIPF